MLSEKLVHLLKPIYFDKSTGSLFI